MLTRGLAALSLSLSLALPAWAKPSCDRTRAPYCGCEKDVAKLCAGKIGDAAIFSCLTSARAKVSPGCAASDVPAWIVDQEQSTKVELSTNELKSANAFRNGERIAIRTWVTEHGLRTDYFVPSQE